MTTVPTPVPGVFYRRPSPDADEFVQPGDEVGEGQTIGLIEVMKSFSELKAPAGGTVKEFLVEDGDEVSVGQDVAVID
jgi:acetyl-CoA carboxylase biotin carboxyl carrier protein